MPYVIEDISKRKEIEQNLVLSQERLDLSLRGANLGAWDWNVQTGKAVYNERWAEMLGYSVDEISPDAGAWEDLIHPDDKPRVMELVTSELRK